MSVPAPPGGSRRNVGTAVTPRVLKSRWLVAMPSCSWPRRRVEEFSRVAAFPIPQLRDRQRGAGAARRQRCHAVPGSAVLRAGTAPFLFAFASSIKSYNFHNDVLFEHWNIAYLLASKIGYELCGCRSHWERHHWHKTERCFLVYLFQSSWFLQVVLLPEASLILWSIAGKEKNKRKKNCFISTYASCEVFLPKHAYMRCARILDKFPVA